MNSTDKHTASKTLNVKLHPIILRFYEVDMEQEFKEMHYEKSILTLRISLLTSLLLYAAFAFLDKLNSPIFFDEFFTIRFIIIIPFLTLIGLISFSNIFKIFWQALMFLSLIISGSGIIYMLHRDPNNMYYYGGLFLIFMGGYFFLKLRFFTASIAGMLLVLIYTITYFIIPHSAASSWLNVLTANAFFIASNVICMIGLYSSEKEERHGFYSQILLNQKQIEIEFANANLEVKVEERTRQLNEAKEKAVESDQLKSAFLANMSHEIRTPMNAVLGFSQLLLKEEIEPEEKAIYSEYIRMNGESLVKIIDDIMDISKIQMKQLSIKLIDFNLHLIFHELHLYYGKLLKQSSKKIKLKLDIPNEIDSTYPVNSDETRIKQILNNLISNAIKYSEQGQICFGYKEFEQGIYFFVEDTGYGISEDNQVKIFERFFQHSDKYVSRQDGTGLGLPISKELVELLGGSLKVNSTLGEGSTFYFQLPLKRKYLAGGELKTIKAVNPVLDLSKYKLLIVDDEESNYVLNKRLLRSSKIQIEWASNGRKAVAMVAENDYDLIIMDIKMPEMDGIEATRLIKKSNNNTPIIIQTAFAMKEVKDEALEAGCDGFTVKPIALDAFLELVNKHIELN